MRWLVSEAILRMRPALSGGMKRCQAGLRRAILAGDPSQSCCVWLAGTGRKKLGFAASLWPLVARLWGLPYREQQVSTRTYQAHASRRIWPSLLSVAVALSTHSGPWRRANVPRLPDANVTTPANRRHSTGPPRVAETADRPLHPHTG